MAGIAGVNVCMGEARGNCRSVVGEARELQGCVGRGGLGIAGG